MDEAEKIDRQEATNGSIHSYIAGFILSVVLTLAAYFIVVNEVLSGPLLIATIVGLAIAQLMVQLVFFLHLGGEGKPRWRLTTFAFMGIVLFILVFGSLWIMYNLDYHMTTTPEELDHEIIEDEGYR
jgi:cytochrome o ubiquinol oxidase operon protein cyoD